MGDRLKLLPSGKRAKGFASSDRKVATVTKKGLVTAKGAGTAKITVKLSGKKTLTLTVKVTDPNAPKKVTIDQGKSATLKKGKTLALTASLSPENARGAINWSTSNKKVARVSAKGVVKAVGKGVATITAKTGNGKKATIKIRVK